MAHGPGLRDRLHDHVALDEIELYAEVLIAVADADHPLSPTEIDRVLGLASQPQVCDPPEPPSAVPGPDHTGPSGTDSGNTNLSVVAPLAPESSGGESAAPAPTGPVGNGPDHADPDNPEPEARFVGPIPPARDGQHPSSVALPSNGALSDNVRAPNPRCVPFPPRFVPWLAWHT